MALADSVPGVSGGTIAFLLGFYDSFINSLNDIMGRDNAKRKKAFFFLIKLGVGWVIGMLLAVSVLANVFESGIYKVSSLFLGFIILAIPVQYQCSNFDEIYQEALKKAIESARVKAEAMAEAGGCKLGTMTNVQEYSSGQQARYYDTSYSSGMAMKEMAMEDAGAGRNLMPGQVDVEAEVSATFSIQ